MGANVAIHASGSNNSDDARHELYIPEHDITYLLTGLKIIHNGMGGDATGIITRVAFKTSGAIPF